MASPSLHLHFVSAGNNYDLDLIPSERESDESITLDGHHYAVIGENSQIAELRRLIPSLHEGISMVSLKEKLTVEEAPTVVLSDKTPESVFSIKLETFMHDIRQLHEEGLLDGECLVAKGSSPILHLRSADVEEVAAGVEPQFMIGSVSKQFFAVALIKALYDGVAAGETESEKIEQVKQLLQLPLSQFLPEEAPLWGGDMPDWAKEVTLHQLLSHTSGLPNYTAYGFLEKDASGKRPCESPTSTQDILKMISKVPLEFAPGSEFSYSNTGYGIIAEVIGTITGMPAAEYLQLALFDPLEMTSTSNPVVGNELKLRESNPRCSHLVPEKMYDAPGGSATLELPLFYEDISGVQGSGSVISTASDLLKWNEALHDKQMVLPKALYELAISENKGGYAYGICRYESRVGLSLHHLGEVGKYVTKAHYFPEQKVSIIQLYYVGIDESKIEIESAELMVELEEVIPDDVKRHEEVMRRMGEKYPDTRGSSRRDDIFDSFLG
jgi:CubicO group peptidase (beta-lactamase class C family)